MLPVSAGISVQVPFRQAHGLAGSCVLLAEKHHEGDLTQLTLGELQEVRYVIFVVFVIFYKNLGCLSEFRFLMHVFAIQVAASVLLLHYIMLLQSCILPVFS